VTTDLHLEETETAIHVVEETSQEIAQTDLPMAGTVIVRTDLHSEIAQTDLPSETGILLVTEGVVMVVHADSPKVPIVVQGNLMDMIRSSLHVTGTIPSSSSGWMTMRNPRINSFQ
jgi:hypothetical protein